MELLEIVNLHITYQGKKEAVKGVSFTLRDGEILAIVGESGSGKTTVIRSLIGLLPPGGEITGGTIRFRGADLTDRGELKKVRGSSIAMIFQDAGAYLNPKRRIRSQFLDFLRFHDKTLTKEEALLLAGEMLRKTHLNDPERVLHAYPFQLSGGQRQRVGIAMAMSQNPALLLADEPTSALDVTVQAEVVREMMHLRDETGAAIIIVTHNMGVASYMADRIAVMKDGEMVEYGTREAVIERPQHAYTKALLASVLELEDDR